VWELTIKFIKFKMRLPSANNFPIRSAKTVIN
jgi:hypothetical protein